MKNKIVIYAIVLVISALLFNYFNKVTDNKLILEQVEKLKTSEEKHKLEAKKYTYQNQKLKDTVAYCKKEIENDNKKIANLKNKLKLQLASVKKYNSKDIAIYYKEQYNLPNQVKTVENGTVLSDTVARLNISDVIRGESCKNELRLTKKVLTKTKSIVTAQDTLLSNKDKELLSTNNALLDCDKAFDLQKSALNNSDKNLKRERNNTLAWKIIAGVGFVLGVVF